MPTKRRRHAITETPPVEAALDELRRELGAERIDLGELVTLGAAAKLDAIRAQRTEDAERLKELAGRVRSKSLDIDLEAAEEARRSWTRR